MKRFGIAVPTLICICLSALTAQAITVTYTFDQTSATTWDAYAAITADAAGTAGLATYSVWVYNVDPALVSFTQNSNMFDGSASQGFYSPGLVQGDVGGNFNAGNFQNFGIGALLGVAKVPVVHTTGSLGVPALLGELTTPASTVFGDLGAISAGLYNVDNTGFYQGAIGVVVAPEPVTLTLLGLGGLALLIRRRR